MLIISGRLAREPELKKVNVDGKKRFVMDNCIFVNSSNQTKDGIPVNITAWDKNATYTAENFEKGQKINIIGIERLHKMKIGDKTFGICSFTVIKIIDWKIYRAITSMLQAFISRMINCADIMPKNLIITELKLDCNKDTQNKTKKQDEEKEKQEKLEAETTKEEIEDKMETELDSAKDCEGNDDQAEDELQDNEETENKLDFEIDELDTDGDAASGYEDKIQVTAEAENEPDGYSEHEEDEDEWTHTREPIGYYVLDFSVVSTEDYHS